MIAKLFRSGSDKEPLLVKHEELKNEAIQLGKRLAARGLPKVTGDSLEPYTGSITSSYRSLLAQYCKPAAVEAPKLAGLESDAYTTRKAALEEDKRRLNDNLQKQTIKRDMLPEAETDVRGNTWLLIIAMGLSILDAVALRRAFSYIEKNTNGVQMGLTVLLVIMFYGIAHMLAALCHRTKNTPIYWAIWTVVITFIGGGMGTLSYMRAEFIENFDKASVAGGGGIDFPWHLIFIFSVMMLIISTYCAYMMPNSNDKKLARERQGLDNSIASLETKLHKVERELENLPNEKYRKESSRLNEQAFNAQKDAQIRGFHNETIGLLKESNLSHRTDRPDCFDMPMPVL